MYVLKHLPEDFVVEELPTVTPAPSGPCLLVKVTKRGLTTEQVVETLAGKLTLSTKAIGYAGMKDKAAVTTQYLTIRARRKEEVERLRIANVSLEVLGFTEEPLALSMLKGNRFTITLRNLVGDENLSLPKSLPNYFDEQRFSSHNVVIGEAILRKEFKTACELIIRYERQHGIVVAIHLDKAKNDFVGALGLLPYRILKLLLHSYQSKLWNDMLASYLVRQGDCSSLEYSQGALEFPRNECENKTIPLPGFGTETADEEIQGLLDAVLKKERLTPRDFVLRQLHNLSLEGGERNALMEVREFDVSAFEDDDCFEGKKKCTLTFALGKGSYATMLIKAILG